MIGLASNVALTATKGLAGFYMNSASLLAEAGHSLSDLLGVSCTDGHADGSIGLCDAGVMEGV